ncbi:hypothetical protein GCM10011579_095850 [Streptomyces albiflavescens]|uniref:DNA helicase n=1 Tax=Streptomyces albiflavescens TaxID=1623582 RepID=A0A918DB78_9ACTN|nr:hypothetical protein GCM10011579_095850 [Streptomyces albiflavescens]
MHHLALQASAGTGKTTTLARLAHVTQRRGRYLAYNWAIAQDARSRFPPTVSCHIGERDLSQKALSNVTLRTAAHFCHTAEPTITRHHVPRLRGLEDKDLHANSPHPSCRSPAKPGPTCSTQTTGSTASRS